MDLKSEQAERVLKLLGDSLEGGKEFVLREAPDVVQQLIVWKRVESVAVISALLSLSLLALLVSRAAHRIFNDERLVADSEKAGFACVVALMAYLACLSFLISAICGGIGYLQVWLAPKVYVLEYCTKLLSG